MKKREEIAVENVAKIGWLWCVVILIATVCSSCMSSHPTCSAYASVAGGSDTAMVISSPYITNGRTVTK